MLKKRPILLLRCLCRTESAVLQSKSRRCSSHGTVAALAQFQYGCASVGRRVAAKRLGLDQLEASLPFGKL